MKNIKTFLTTVLIATILFTSTGCNLLKREVITNENENRITFSADDFQKIQDRVRGEQRIRRLKDPFGR
jgi:hypothetical protein